MSYTAPDPIILIPPDLSPDDLIQPSGAHPIHLCGETMGTTWSLRAFAPDSVSSDDLTNAIGSALQSVIDEMSTWTQDSFISWFNHAAPGTSFDPPKHFQAVWEQTVFLATASQGALNPCHGAETRQRGFGPDMPGLPSFRARHAWEGDPIRASGGLITQPGDIELDLSATAKGYAVDLAAGALVMAGIEAFLMEIGGEYVGRGVKPDASPWWVDLQTPSPQSQRYRVALCHRAMATSGDLYRRKNGVSHIVGQDQATGFANCVTVFARDCLTADGWATALYAAGENGPDMADRNQLSALFQHGDGTATLSSAMSAWAD